MMVAAGSDLSGGASSGHHLHGSGLRWLDHHLRSEASRAAAPSSSPCQERERLKRLMVRASIYLRFFAQRLAQRLAQKRSFFFFFLHVFTC